MALLTSGAHRGSPAEYHSQPLRLIPIGTNSASWLALGGSNRSDEFSRREGWTNDTDPAWYANHGSAAVRLRRYAVSQPDVHAPGESFGKAPCRTGRPRPDGRDGPEDGHPPVGGVWVGASKPPVKRTNSTQLIDST